MFPSINKKLLPMKGHYFFFNAATAPVIPFLPVIARQLGFSGTIVGIIYTVLPILAMVAKPVMGGIADKFKIKKVLFISFQILMTISLFSINFIPEVPKDTKVHFSCDYGESVFDTSAGNISIKDNCATARIRESLNSKDAFYCKLTCNSLDPIVRNTMCEHWLHGLHFCLENKTTIELDALVPSDRIEIFNEVMVFKVANVSLPDGSVTKPFCPPKHKISLICDMNCNSPVVNEIVAIPKLNDSEIVGVYQFWLFLCLAIVAWVSMAIVVSISDAICFELLADKPNLYGNQRLWGSIGWGIFSIFAGLLVDSYSENDTKKDYTSVFYLMACVMLIGISISSRLKYTQQKFSTNILRDVGKLLLDCRVFVYVLWCIFCGACTGLVWQYLFWLIEDIAKVYDGQDCGTASWIKTLEGLAMGIQCLGGELPFFFLSGWILNRIGHIHCMSFVLLGIGIRFTLYSFLTNPWLILPVELMNGITFGLFYATMASYASIVAPPGTEATIQGLVGAVFEGVGVSLGSLIGGLLYDNYGGWVTFRVFGIAALICSVLHFILQYFMNKGNKTTGKEQGLNGVTNNAKI